MRIRADPAAVAEAVLVGPAASVKFTVVGPVTSTDLLWSLWQGARTCTSYGVLLTGTLVSE